MNALDLNHSGQPNVEILSIEINTMKSVIFTSLDLGRYYKATRKLLRRRGNYIEIPLEKHRGTDEYSRSRKKNTIRKDVKCVQTDLFELRENCVGSNSIGAKHVSKKREKYWFGSRLRMWGFVLRQTKKTVNEKNRDDESISYTISTSGSEDSIFSSSTVVVRTNEEVLSTDMLSDSIKLEYNTIFN